MRNHDTAIFFMRQGCSLPVETYVKIQQSFSILLQHKMLLSLVSEIEYPSSVGIPF